MKKSILILGTVLFLTAGTAVFTSCNNKNSSDKTEQKKSEVKTDKYACPMHCEGDKTYDKSGKCPTCGMDLKKVEANLSH